MMQSNAVGNGTEGDGSITSENQNSYIDSTQGKSLNS